MKRFFTLYVLMLLVIFSKAQAVLNEVYPQPGNGYSEFFELYNEYNSTENLDNYTIVAYYEEGTKTGFYVMDLPNQSVVAHGYYVGASQNPFDIQGQLGLTANFNCNAKPAGGSITKWESNGSSYTTVAVPANLNDFFVKITGSGGVFHVFLYKNGIIVNGLIAGFSSTSIPAYIKSMPNLPIDMSGSSPDFTINFNSISDNSVEYLTNSAGTNNGYFRSSDGLCGDWLKSDAPGQHTPGATNGTISSGPGNQLGVAAVISQYAADPTKSLLTYNIVSGPAAAFPVNVYVYSDLGIASLWDINDVLLDTKTIASAPSGSQYVVLPSGDVAVIIVVKTATDCYDTTLAIGNYWSILPINLISFQGNINSNNKTFLQWKVGNNETTDKFEVERSFDGKEFKTVGLVFTSEKEGTEDYIFYETLPVFEKAMYRLKITSKTNEINYSKILTFQNKITTNNNLKIIGNPAKDQLILNYTAGNDYTINIRIFDMTGRVIMSNKVSSLKGDNMISFPLASNMKASIYTVEVTNGTDTQAKTFIKQ
jgi:hypothetical protein